MNKIIGLAALAIGVVLLVLGINATDSFASEVSEFFGGSPTNESIWMIIGGIVLGAVGLGLTLFRRRIA